MILSMSEMIEEGKPEWDQGLLRLLQHRAPHQALRYLIPVKIYFNLRDEFTFN